MVGRRRDVRGERVVRHRAAILGPYTPAVTMPSADSREPGDAFDRIPKVELHCHVEGTVRAATVVELARKAGRPLPVDDPADLYRYDSLDSFLAVFWLVQETLVDRADWARVAYESLVDGAAHGLRYREMFFTPARHLAAGQDLGTIVDGLSEGIAAAEAETGVRCCLIADIDRAYGPAAGLELVERLGELRQSGRAERVIGVGADSTELGVDLGAFAPAFVAARRLGFRRTCHAGEAVGVGPENIRIAIDELGAERIDHGVAIAEDRALMARVAAEGIPMTVCPRSNVVIANRFQSLEEHPLARDARCRPARDDQHRRPRNDGVGSRARIPGGRGCLRPGAGGPLSVGHRWDRLHVARRPGPARADGRIRVGARSGVRATGASRAERPGVGFGHHAVHGRATTMTMRSSLEQALHLPEGETLRRLEENGLAITNVDTMAQAIHDVYCGIMADHDHPNEKDRTQAQALVDALQKQASPQ